MWCEANSDAITNIESDPFVDSLIGDDSFAGTAFSAPAPTSTKSFSPLDQKT